MSQHHALGKTGCSGRVNQSGDLIRAVILHWLRFDILIQGTDANPTQTRHFRDHRVMPLGMRSSMRGHACGVKHTTGAAVIPDFIDLPRGETRVHEHWPSVQTSCSKQNGNKGSAVVADDHRPITWAHTQALQPYLSISNYRS